MKKTYVAPACEAIVLCNEDILTMSVMGQGTGMQGGWNSPDSVF